MFEYAKGNPLECKYYYIPTNRPTRSARARIAPSCMLKRSHASIIHLDNACIFHTFYYVISLV